MLVPRFVYSSMQFFYETSVHFHRTTRRYIPDDGTVLSQDKLDVSACNESSLDDSCGNRRIVLRLFNAMKHEIFAHNTLKIQLLPRKKQLAFPL
jgi:hypothetical protein